MVTQYIPSNRHKIAGFEVRLGTKKVKFPTRCLGKKRVDEPKHLERQRFHPSLKSHLPPSHPVVIMYYDSNRLPHHISFSLERHAINIVHNLIPEGAVPQASFVQPCVLSLKKNGNTNVTKMISPDETTRWQYLLNGGLFHYDSKSQRRKKKKAILVQCPCHQSMTCPFRDMCGPCSVHSRDEPTQDVALEGSPCPDIGFDLDILLQPDARVLEIPFETNDSIVPSAALYLNELNLLSGKHQVISEAIFMARLKECAMGTITNKDIFSLYPHNNISGSIFNLMVGW